MSDFPAVEIRPACPKCASANTVWLGSRDGRWVRRKCRECDHRFNVILVSAVEVLRVEFVPPKRLSER